MKLRYFLTAVILALIIGSIIYNITNDTLVKSINRIQEHNQKLDEMNKLLSR